MSGSGRRSSPSAGLAWASRLSTLGFEFSAPPLLGYYLDGRFGWTPVGTLVSMVLGFAVGMMHVLRFARDASKPG